MALTLNPPRFIYFLKQMANFFLVQTLKSPAYKSKWYLYMT